MSVAIIIVAWKVRDLVLACLQSVFDEIELSGFDVTVWLVDNLSEDGTPAAVRAQFPAVHVIEPQDNLGFAKGNNLALREIGFPDGTNLPDFVLLLNPDTVVQPGALQELLNGMQNTGAGLGGSRLVYGDGSFQHSAFSFPGLAQLIIDVLPVPGRLVETRLNGRYSRDLYAGFEPFEVDHPLGATFCLRREVIQKVGMFDESFYLYCEEVDWALRIRKAGWKAVCVPRSVVIHLGGQSSAQVRPQSIINLWTARLKLYRKYYNPLKRGIAVTIVRMGMNRLIQKAAHDSSQTDDVNRSLVDAYKRVIELCRQL